MEETKNLKKYWKPLLAVICIVIIIAVLYAIFPKSDINQSQIDQIEADYVAYYSQFWPDGEVECDIVWDRAVDGAKNYSLQYVGIYGDCAAFLQYSPNSDAIDEPIPVPCCIDYDFFQRPVYLRNNAYLYFYNFNERRFLTAAAMVTYSHIQWLTDEQKQQLAQDIEEIGRKFG